MRQPAGRKIKFGIGRMPKTMADFLSVTKQTEASGFWGLGVGDGHYLNYELYPAITVALLNTQRIVVGPCVTNAKSRSWSIHASSARMFEELAPGRFVLPIATGDGSVHSVGLPAQRWADLEADIVKIRQRSPAGLQIQVTVSGPKGAAAAGRVGDAVIIAVGDDIEATNHLARVAREARAAAGISSPLEVWVMIPMNVAERESDLEAARQANIQSAVGTARFAFFSSFENKNVPERFQAPLRERLNRYSHQHHGSWARDNPNVKQFADEPELLRYLSDRMTLVGTREQFARRVERLVSGASLDGMWLAVNPADGADIVRRAGEALAPMLAGR